MIPVETINQIKEMKHKGESIKGIAEKLSISTWTVQKYIKTESKEPLTVVSPEGIESLKSIIDKLSKRVEVLEIFKQNTEQHKTTITTTKPPEPGNEYQQPVFQKPKTYHTPTLEETLKNFNPDRDQPEKKFYTVRDIGILTGLAENTVHQWLVKRGVKQGGKSPKYKVSKKHIMAFLEFINNAKHSGGYGKIKVYNRKPEGMKS
jgi:tetrahydromethanopterin S-methyltransferase subunit G